MLHRTLLALLLLAALAPVALPTLPAQTPADANEGARLFPDPANPGAYTFSWWGKAGRTYFLQQSDDLSLWTYLPVIEPGADQPIRWNVASSAPKSFLRLRLSDIPTGDPFNADFDGDSVSNWDEVNQGTDPFSAALDPANGLPLDWEKFYHVAAGTDPNSLAPRGDGLTYLQAFQQRLNPLDYYNGAAPVVEVIADEEQRGAPGEFMPRPFVVKVSRAGTDGEPLRNAPVRFTATAGGQLGEAATNGPVAAGAEIIARTDRDGLAFVFLKPPAGMPDAVFPVRIAPLGGGPSASASTVTARTINDAVPPAAPTNLLALGDVSAGSLLLLWTASPHAAGYVVERRYGDQWVELPRIDARETSLATWTNDRVNSGLRVRAINAAGPSAPVDFPPPVSPLDPSGPGAPAGTPPGAAATSAAPPPLAQTSPPPPPTDLRVVNGVITWTNPPGYELTGYLVEDWYVPPYSYLEPLWRTYAYLDTHGQPSTSVSLVDCEPTTGQRYRVRVRNASGLSAPCAPVADTTEEINNYALWEFVDGTEKFSALCSWYSVTQLPVVELPFPAGESGLSTGAAEQWSGCDCDFVADGYPLSHYSNYIRQFRYRFRGEVPLRLRHEWIEWIWGYYPPTDGTPFCGDCPSNAPTDPPCKDELMTFANVRSFTGDGRSKTSPEIYRLAPGGVSTGKAELKLDALSLWGTNSAFAGDGTGDSVQWRGVWFADGVVCDPSVTVRWKAVGPETHLGPSGKGAQSRTWTIAVEDFNWKPGTYVVSFEVGYKETGTLHIEKEVCVGWRTEEFMVVGQFLNRAHDTLSAKEEKALREALAGNTTVRNYFQAKVAAARGLTFQTTQLWATDYLTNPLTWLFPNSWKGPLPETNQRQQLFATQTLLNAAPDREGLPAIIQPGEAPEKSTDLVRLGYLNSLLEDKEFRMLTRFQAEIMTDDAGSKIRGARMRVADSPKGRTKLTYYVEAGELYPGSPARELGRFPGLMVPDPEASAYNGRMRVSADGQSLSGYGDGRIGPEGQRPNWGLFGTAAPWIFAETIWHRRKDGRGFDPEIKTSVTASYLPNTNQASGHDPFNEITVYRLVKNRTNNSVRYVRLRTLEMLGHLKAFIESGDATLPGLPPQPFVKP